MEIKTNENERGYFVDVNGIVCTFENGYHNCSYGHNGYLLEKTSYGYDILLLGNPDPHDDESFEVIDSHQVWKSLIELGKVLEINDYELRKENKNV